MPIKDLNIIHNIHKSRYNLYMLYMHTYSFIISNSTYKMYIYSSHSISENSLLLFSSVYIHLNTIVWPCELCLHEYGSEYTLIL